MLLSKKYPDIFMQYIWITKISKKSELFAPKLVLLTLQEQNLTKSVRNIEVSAITTYTP